MYSQLKKIQNIHPAIILLLILVLSLFLFTFRLGDFALFDFDEATYAQVTRDTIGSGDCLTLTYGAASWFEKPPLGFWLMIGSARLFGLTEFAFRLPLALLGVIGIFLTWLVAYQLSRSYWTAHLAALILLFTPEFVYAGRQIRFDVPVTTAILFSVFCFLRGRERRGWYLGFGAGIALGVMIKSVIGFFALPIILIFSLVYKQWRWLKDRYFWLGIILAAALIAPWHIYEALKFGKDFWRTYFVWNILTRFITPFATDSLGQGRSPLYYVKLLFIFVEPWFPLFVFWAGYLLYKHKLKYRDYPKIQLAAGIVVMFIFLLFAAARSKLWFYLEPIYPFMAIFLAAGFIGIIKFYRQQEKFVPILLIFCFFLLGLFNTVWQITYLRAGSSDEYGFAWRERDIGKYLAGHFYPAAVYTVHSPWTNTIAYYSGRAVTPTASVVADDGRLAAPLDSLIIDDKPFFLILPTNYVPRYKNYKDFKVRATSVLEYYNYVSLYEFAASPAVPENNQ